MPCRVDCFIVIFQNSGLRRHLLGVGLAVSFCRVQDRVAAISGARPIMIFVGARIVVASELLEAESDSRAMSE